MKFRVPFTYNGKDYHVDIDRLDDSAEPVILEIIADKMGFSPIIPPLQLGAEAPNFTDLLREQLEPNLKIGQPIPLDGSQH